MTEYEELMAKNAKSQQRRDIVNIIIAAFVGLCSLLVGVCSVLVARYGNKTAELQAMIAKNAEAPIFEIIYTPPYENDSKEPSIEVSILEGKYSNFDSEIRTFLSFNFTETSSGYWTSLNKVDLPALSYYTGGNEAGPRYGVVDTWTGTSASELDSFLRDCVACYTGRMSFTDQPTSIQITIVTYLKLTYLNLLGDEEAVYYCIDPDSHISIVQIDSKQGEEKFEKYDTMIYNGLFVNIAEDNPSDKADVFQRIEMTISAGL